MKPYVRSILGGPSAEGTAWLRVLTYNVLAQSLIRRDLYSTNGSSIRWAVRFPALTEEMEAYRPNLMFLQEVDAGKLNEWKKLLEQQNMEHEFCKASTKSHGVLIAWSSDIFRLAKDSLKTIDYDEHTELPMQTVTGNVGLLLALERIDTDEKYIVATTHLYWHPNADYERLRQAAILMHEIAGLQSESVPLILGADLNSTPDSPTYRFLTDGLQLNDQMKGDLLQSAKHSNFGRIGASEAEGRTTLLADPAKAVDQLVQYASAIHTLSPQLNPESCYRALTGSEPEFTNWTSDFRETIDYILFTKPLSVSGILSLPASTEMGAEPSSLPRSSPTGNGYPSDHLPLMAEFC